MNFTANPLAALIGRPASSFTAAELDALPELTAFAHGRHRPFIRIGAHWHIGGRTGPYLTSAEMPKTECICVAVGEPPEDALDRLLPRPVLPLPELAIAATLRGHLEAASAALDEYARTGSESACADCTAQIQAAILTLTTPPTPAVTGSTAGSGVSS